MKRFLRFAGPVLAGVLIVLLGTTFYIEGTQHGGPTEARHVWATWLGLAFIALGIALQFVFRIRAWFSPRAGSLMKGRTRWAQASIIAVGVVLAVTGAVYVSDGLQPGAPGGQAMDPETGLPDPARSGGTGEAGSAGDVVIGSVLIATGILVQLASYVLARPGFPSWRAGGVSSPQR